MNTCSQVQSSSDGHLTRMKSLCLSTSFLTFSSKGKSPVELRCGGPAEAQQTGAPGALSLTRPHWSNIIGLNSWEFDGLVLLL